MVRNLLTCSRVSSTHKRRHACVRCLDSVPRTGLGTHLLCLHEVGHVAIVVYTAGKEARTCALTADARDEAGLGLLVGGIHRADGHHPTDDFQQPVTTAHLVLPQGHMQQLVPVKQVSFGSLHQCYKGRSQSQVLRSFP